VGAGANVAPAHPSSEVDKGERSTEAGVAGIHEVSGAREA